MAARADPTEDEVITTLKRALDREKYELLGKTSNRYNSRDLSRTFNELNQVVEDVVKAKYGRLQHRHEYEQGKLFPMLERVMERSSRAILRRMSPRMSKLHPWLVCFEVAIPQEVFGLLHKSILGESSYGLEIEESPRCISLKFTKLRRLVVLFNKFIDCGGFEKQFKGGKGHAKVIVDSEKKGVFNYMLKEEILKGQIHYGYWNEHGISQH